jgi:hypothetical protein
MASRHLTLTGVVLVLVGVIVSCHDVTMRADFGERGSVAADVVEAKYFRTRDGTYVSVRAEQGGWLGWKERHLSRDGLIVLQLVFKIPLADYGRLYQASRDCEGYVFAETAVGPIGAWSVARGTLQTDVTKKGFEIAGDFQLEPTYPKTRLGQPGRFDNVHFAGISLAADPGLGPKVLTRANITIEPRLKAWEEPLNGGGQR